MAVWEAAMIKLHIDTYGACKKSLVQGILLAHQQFGLRADGQYFDEH